MSFLSIAFLTALPLAAAPLLLHLFDRRRNAVIEWGAMQFLMDAVAQRTSARRLKQWLLLLLRTLAVAALVFALARPMLPGNWFGRAERGETILLIDNSMSMLRTNGEQSLFDDAVQRAAKIVAETRSGDAVRVMLTSPYPVWATAGSVRMDSASRESVTDQIRELEVTHGQSDLLSALLTATQVEAAPTQQNRRIIVITDGQGSDWNTDDEAGWQRFREILKAAPLPTELSIVEVASASTAANVAINNIRSNRTVVGVNQPFTVSADVRNHGRTTSDSASATWKVGGDALHESHVPDLDGDSVHSVVWKHSFAETGVYSNHLRTRY